MSKNRDRTVYRRSVDGKWTEKRNDQSRGPTFETQAEAIASAHKNLVREGGGELTIKGRDGKIRSKDTIGGGNDPMPPRDREH